MPAGRIPFGNLQPISTSSSVCSMPAGRIPFGNIQPTGASPCGNNQPGSRIAFGDSPLAGRVTSVAGRSPFGSRNPARSPCTQSQPAGRATFSPGTGTLGNREPDCRSISAEKGPLAFRSPPANGSLSYNSQAAGKVTSADRSSIGNKTPITRRDSSARRGQSARRGLFTERSLSDNSASTNLISSSSCDVFPEQVQVYTYIYTENLKAGNCHQFGQRSYLSGIFYNSQGSSQIKYILNQWMNWYPLNYLT
jgi:hypothetical protein